MRERLGQLQYYGKFTQDTVIMINGGVVATPTLMSHVASNLLEHRCKTDALEAVSLF